MIREGDVATHREYGDVRIVKVGACTYGVVFTEGGTNKHAIVPHEDVREKKTGVLTMFRGILRSW